MRGYEPLKMIDVGNVFCQVIFWNLVRKEIHCHLSIYIDINIEIMMKIK